MIVLRAIRANRDRCHGATACDARSRADDGTKRFTLACAFGKERGHERARHCSPGNDAPDEEYDELLQLIVDAEWHPGDIVRTYQGRQMAVSQDSIHVGFPRCQ